MDRLQSCHRGARDCQAEGGDRVVWGQMGETKAQLLLAPPGRWAVALGNTRVTGSVVSFPLFWDVSTPMFGRK